MWLKRFFLTSVYFIVKLFIIDYSCVTTTLWAFSHTKELEDKYDQGHLRVIIRTSPGMTRVPCRNLKCKNCHKCGQNISAKHKKCYFKCNKMSLNVKRCYKCETFTVTNVKITCATPIVVITPLECMTQIIFHYSHYKFSHLLHLFIFDVTFLHLAEIFSQLWYFLHL